MTARSRVRSEQDPKAAQYVRMSTDHQRYSIDNQIDAIREYAGAHRIQIVKTYADPGRSGLTLRGRPGLRQLLADVQKGGAAFDTLLVLDVSRWGRFPDPDEAAAYEHLCRSHGVNVIYCDEPFDNTGGPINALIKNLKRTMAGEYSRELSGKVFRGQAKVSSLGYRAGSRAPYGYERWAVDPDSGARVKLGPGIFKAVMQWRTVLVPGPADEVALIQRIFRLWVGHRRGLEEIAATLTAEGWPTRGGGPWAVGTLRHILRSEVYLGTLSYNRTSKKLLGPRTDNPPRDWVVVRGAFEAIIEQDVFDAAQARFAGRRPVARDLTDAAMIDGLVRLLKREGRLSGALIDAERDLPSRSAYVARFGSWGAAMALAGDRPEHNRAYQAQRRKVDGLRTQLAGMVRLHLDAAGHQTKSLGPMRFDLAGREVAVMVKGPAGRSRPPLHWELRIGKAAPDIAFIARLAEGWDEALDFYVVPIRQLGWVSLPLGPGSRTARLGYRSDSFDHAISSLRHLAAIISRAP